MILIVFLIIYILFVLFFLVLSLFNVFHAIKFGINSRINKLMLKVYIFISVLLLLGTIFVASAIDWTVRSDLLPTGNILQVPGY
jgi:hypothetical protein